MQKLDAAGWLDGICFVAHGVRIGIRVNDRAVLDHLPERFPPGWKPAPSPVVDELYSIALGCSGDNLLYRGAKELARTTDLGEVLGLLESDLDFSVAMRSRHGLFVHAGVVGWRGRAIVVPGRSGSGKSTLVSALIRRGATYYSDEYAVFDGRGRVHPYPRPLRLRRQKGERPAKYAIADFGGVPGTKPLPVGLIVSTRFRPGCRWHPRALSPGEAVLALLRNTLVARTRPAFALARLQRVVSGVPALEGARGDAADFLPLLLKHS